MQRRTVLKGLLAGAVAAGFSLPLANASNYRGKVFVFVQADGAWDPTSFCDPKPNSPGEPVINHWAERDDVRQVGNIRYAPFAHNASFFEKYYDRMLVINGVDAQTNSHTVGVVHNWSGRNSEGYPGMGAILAAHYGGGLPVAYLNFGGYSETAGIARYTRLNNAGLLRNIAAPAEYENGDGRHLAEADWEAIRGRLAHKAARLTEEKGLLPTDARNRNFFETATQGSELLRGYADSIPAEQDLEEPRQWAGPDNRVETDDGIRRQAQLTVLAFKAGVAVSADLFIGGFDTHSLHDAYQGWLLGALTDGVDYLWDYAEEHGVADRMVVVMGSDFGRTNFYNSQQGKDHWPIGSFVIMEKNQPWTNREVGETDDLHFARRINPTTLERDDANGTIIYPKHVHTALRRYLGIENTPGAQRFPFNNTEDFAFFG